MEMKNEEDGAFQVRMCKREGSKAGKNWEVEDASRKCKRRENLRTLSGVGHAIVFFGIMKRGHLGRYCLFTYDLSRVLCIPNFGVIILISTR